MFIFSAIGEIFGHPLALLTVAGSRATKKAPSLQKKMTGSTCCVDPAIFCLEKLLTLRYLAAQVRQRCLQILVRVDWRVADADLIVQMGTRRASAVSDVANHLAANHHLASNNRKARHVTVDSLNSVAMINDDLAAV